MGATQSRGKPRPATKSGLVPRAARILMWQPTYERFSRGALCDGIEIMLGLGELSLMV